MTPVTNKVQSELALGPKLSIINLVDCMVDHANTLRASDIHIDPSSEKVDVRFRIDGVLQDAHVFPKDIHSEVISRIKILAGLRTDEHQTAQDGRFRIVFEDGRPIDVRVSIAPTYYGENAVLRLLSDKAEEFSLKSLGFSPENEEKILKAIKKPYGMILATGPTGSGKTTTLYTILKILNVRDVSIITIEDPIEYSIEGINQMSVNPRTGLTFATGLRSILRQDPNVIMVGEIRDADTAGIAVNTSLTGHLLLSTLHTNDAATTLPRLLDMRIEPYLIASTVNVALGQRLVRKICENCKTKKNITSTEAKSLSEVLPIERMGDQKIFWYGKGCDECNNSGYRGRIGIHEVMIMDPVIQDAVLRKAHSTEIRELAVKQGMKTMVEDGFEKAKVGVTTVEELLRMLHE
jgi:type IV pilus assembly protein PilB